MSLPDVNERQAKQATNPAYRNNKGRTMCSPCHYEHGGVSVSACPGDDVIDPFTGLLLVNDLATDGLTCLMHR